MFTKKNLEYLHYVATCVAKRKASLKPSVSLTETMTTYAIVLPVPKVSNLNTYIVYSNVKLTGTPEVTLKELIYKT